MIGKVTVLPFAFIRSSGTVTTPQVATVPAGISTAQGPSVNLGV
jgi:hypothetical protein